jgi:hypothetical protein
MKTRKYLVVSFALSVTLFTLPAIAKADALPAACGADATQYKVSHTNTEPTLTPPAGQALIVLIQKPTGEEFASDPILRLAVDGTWVGAVKGNSYIAIAVSPGSHNLCVSRQSKYDDEKSNLSTAPLNAQAGSVYYYEFILNHESVGFAGRANGGAGGSASAPGTGSTPDMTAKRNDTIDTVTFTQIKEDAAPYQMRKMRTSVWTTK